MLTNPEALKQAIQILTEIEGLNVTQTLAVFRAIDLIDNHMETQDRIHFSHLELEELTNEIRSES
jgi:hypothetical protein